MSRLLAWLAELEAKRRERTEAIQAAQTRLAKSTLWAAWIAAGLAAVTLGFLYVQDQTAKSEAARHAVIREGLRTLYEQGTDLLKEGVPLINSTDQDKSNKFIKNVDNFSGNAEKWVKENMGNACVDRLMEIPSGFQQIHGSNQRVVVEINGLMGSKRDLADLIDNDACVKGK
jgi:hypothetical protein